MKVRSKIMITLFLLVSILFFSQLYTVQATDYITTENLTSKQLEDGTKLISGFEIGTKISDISSDKYLINPEQTTFTIFDNQNNNITSNKDNRLCTGYKINFTTMYQDMKQSIADINEQSAGVGMFVSNYITVIYGDVNGDGLVSAVDALAIVKNKLGTISFTSEAYVEAGRITENTRKTQEIPSAIDALAAIKYKLDSENNPINQRMTQTTNPPTEDDDNNPPTTESNTPLSLHGSLSVSGSNLVDKNGEKFQLKGVSTHGIAWFPQYVNKDTFKYMRDEWGINVVRLAMYSNPNDGYTREVWNTVKNGVNYATDLGLYVIVDWHILNDNNPNTYKSEAIEFFKEMATTYKDNENVIYEICNEPNGNVTWLNDVKPYAEEVISKIREIDEDAIILCGTPNWSQDVDVVSENPITGYENIMYTLHFYAATHKENLRNKLSTALNNNLPIFVSEFGICSADGNGTIDVEEANSWMSVLNKNNISYVCWNLTNKNEASSILSSTTNKITDWTDDDLSLTGKWLVKTFKSPKIHYKFSQNNLTINIKDGNGIDKVECTLTDSQDEKRAEIILESANLENYNDKILKNKKGDIIEIEYNILNLIPDTYEIITKITEKDGNIVTFTKEYNKSE